MQRPLTTLCWIIFGSGLFLLVAAALQALGLVWMFNEPPWWIGVVLTAIGGLLLATRRR